MHRLVKSDVESDDEWCKYSLRSDGCKCVAVFRINVCAYMYIRVNVCAYMYIHVNVCAYMYIHV